jgi:hypothetical protein
MRRALFLALILLIATAAYTLRPAAEPAVTPDLEQAREEPNAAGCVVSIARGETGRADVFGASSLTARGGRSEIGNGSVPIEQLTPSGPGYGLVELTTAGGAGVASSSDIALTAATCSPATRGTIALSGVSTANGHQVDLVLANPYALDAIIAVTTISEVGADTAGELETLVVPAGAVVVRDLSRILPLRSHLSLVITPSQGSVHAVVYETTGSDGRASEAVPGQDEWWVVMPDLPGVDRHLTIVSTSVGSEAFQMDLWALDGLNEAAIDDVVPAGAQFDIPSAETGDAQAVRIISSNATVVALSMTGDGVLAGGPAAPGLFGRWLLAGAGALPGSTIAWVFNPSPDSAQITVSPVAGGDPIVVSIGGSARAAVPLPSSAAGYVLDSSAPVAVAWTTLGVGLAYSPGVPLDG